MPTATSCRWCELVKKIITSTNYENICMQNYFASTMRFKLFSVKQFLFILIEANKYYKKLKVLKVVRK